MTEKTSLTSIGITLAIPELKTNGVLINYNHHRARCKCFFVFKSVLFFSSKNKTLLDTPGYLSPSGLVMYFIF
jgi:hypothetical protein